MYALSHVFGSFIFYLLIQSIKTLISKRVVPIHLGKKLRCLIATDYCEN
jgi:hypothetical protein